MVGTETLRSSIGKQGKKAMDFTGPAFEKPSYSRGSSINKNLDPLINSIKKNRSFKYSGGVATKIGSWYEYLDKTTYRAYFFDEKTKKSFNGLPLCALIPAKNYKVGMEHYETGWEARIDRQTNKVYYYEQFAGTVQWQVPLTYKSLVKSCAYLRKERPAENSLIDVIDGGKAFFPAPPKSTYNSYTLKDFMTRISLMDIFRDIYLFLALLQYAQKNHAHENLLFWMSVEVLLNRYGKNLKLLGLNVTFDLHTIEEKEQSSGRNSVKSSLWEAGDDDEELEQLKLKSAVSSSNPITVNPPLYDNIQSLFEKIGGHPAVLAAVNLFYDKIEADKSVSHFFKGIPMNIQRKKLVLFFHAAFNGPLQYSGQSLYEAHKKLVLEGGLNDTHFDIIAKHLIDTLVELNVPQDLRDEAVGRVAALRDDVLCRRFSNLIIRDSISIYDMFLKPKAILLICVNEKKSNKIKSKLDRLKEKTEVTKDREITVANNEEVNEMCKSMFLELQRSVYENMSQDIRIRFLTEVHQLARLDYSELQSKKLLSSEMASDLVMMRLSAIAQRNESSNQARRNSMNPKMHLPSNNIAAANCFALLRLNNANAPFASSQLIKRFTSTAPAVKGKRFSITKSSKFT